MSNSTEPVSKKALRCKLGIHNYRMSSYQANDSRGGYIIVDCKRCGKSDIEQYFYWDTFWNMVFLYCDMELNDKLRRFYE